MTREEIIQGLQFTIDMFLFDPASEEALEKPRNDMDKTTIDACKGAIELLQQEPCEDAISREDAMSMILCYGNEIKAEVMDDIKASMIKLPPVQPKIKTGHWIHRSTDDYGGITTWYECSECGRAVEDIYHVYGEYPYCHCGAKMIEPQESENKE